jgi:AcrR family transcriptional regulator
VRAPESRPPTTGNVDDWPARQDVISVSSALFAERGYYSVSMEDIAAATDISRATLYRYFSTKTKILADLTTSALSHSRRLAADLHALAESGPDAVSLRAWMSRYVTFHRTFNGVIRAWFDGAVAEQLSSEELRSGIETMRAAATSVLDNARLPGGMDRRAATAIFMAVLGRMTEPVAPGASDADSERIATLMVVLLQRSLLRSHPAGPEHSRGDLIRDSAPTA